MSMRGAFAAQARACARLGSPLMERLLPVLGDMIDPGSALGLRLAAWPGDLSAAGDAVPLRLAAALHALVLAGRGPALAAAFAGADDAALRAAVAAALVREAAHVDGWLDRPPQTNEVRRSAVAIAGAGWIAAALGGQAAGGQAAEWLELGASAGLNLWWDRWALDGPGWVRGSVDAVLRLAPEWEGDAPPGAVLPVARRAGVDLFPADPARDGLRLLSYIWADQPDRLARTRLALAVATASPLRVEAGDAGDWLAARPAFGGPRVVFHSVAWQYFPEPTRRRALAAMEAAARPEAPVFRLAMEADGRPESAAVTVTRWPGGRVVPLGRAGFHGQRILWTAPAP
jgi:hypothetical protein